MRKRTVHRICPILTAINLLMLIPSGCCHGATRVGGKESGIASWYGAEYHGKKAASGEIFNMHDLTCAHRTLPFGTILRVMNKYNGKSVVVRVNDRGPYIDGRIVDLSLAAAQEIGMVKNGLVRVVIEILELPGQKDGQVPRT